MVILKMIYLKKTTINYGYFEDDLSQKNIHKTMVILKMIYLKKNIHKTMVILKMIYLEKTSIKLWLFWRWSISKEQS